MNEKLLMLMLLAALGLAGCNSAMNAGEKISPPATASSSSSAPVAIPGSNNKVDGGGKQPDTPAKVCTMDAKLCPDGSYVSRNSANNCAFSPCPGEQK